MSKVSGSNNRKLNNRLGFRISDRQRELLDQHAQGLGFKNANELARYRMGADFAAVFGEVGEAPNPLATAS